MKESKSPRTLKQLFFIPRNEYCTTGCVLCSMGYNVQCALSSVMHTAHCITKGQIHVNILISKILFKLYAAHCILYTAHYGIYIASKTMQRLNPVFFIMSKDKSKCLHLIGTILRKVLVSLFPSCVIWPIWDGSTRKGLTSIDFFFGFDVKPLAWWIYFQTFCNLVCMSFKYHCAFLKLLVYQGHLWNLAKTASELGFQILFWNLVQFQPIWK